MVGTATTQPITATTIFFVLAKNAPPALPRGMGERFRAGSTPKIRVVE